MSMNIKNEEAHEMARELAEHTGESLTKAVTEAIRERRDRVVGKNRDERFEAIMASSRRTSAILKEKGLTLDEEFLFDDDGLPR